MTLGRFPRHRYHETVHLDPSSTDPIEAGNLMSSDREPRILTEQGVTVITFDATVKMINEDVVNEAGPVFLEAAECNPPLVVVDLEGIEFFSSSFIEVLFRLWSRLNKRSGQFAVCNLFPYCREVLQITNLDSLWTLCDSRAEAIAALKSAAAD